MLVLGAGMILFAATAEAAPVRVSAATDWWFEITEPSVFQARTFAVDNVWSDPMLWLYGSDDRLVTANDDWFGLQSYVSVNLEPGSYRLRTGVCCGDPDRWYDGVQYDLESNVGSWNPVTTTSEPTLTTVTSTTSSSTSSTTTTTQLPSTTTTSTIFIPPLTSLTVPSSTTTENPLNGTVWFSSSSVPPNPTTIGTPTTTIRRPVPTVSSMPGPRSTTTSTTFLPTTSSVFPSTIPGEVPVSVVEATTTVPQGEAQAPPENPLQKRYTKRVGVGPFTLTLTVTGQQRRTVVAAAIVQITTVATMTGGTTTRTTNRRTR